MATEAILVGMLFFNLEMLLLFTLDIGTLYKRLFNHRPIIQNEVNFFVKEFEVYNQCACVDLASVYIV